jgi:hypothetical protein
MGKWTGTVYASATLTANGDSGWIDMEALVVAGYHSTHPVRAATTTKDITAFDSCFLRLVPADLATDETLDLDLNVGWTAAGIGDLKLHDFTQVTSTNAAEALILPGGDSETVTFVEVGTNAGSHGAVIPPYWKLAWTLGGTTKSMSFVLYGSLAW